MEVRMTGFELACEPLLFLLLCPPAPWSRLVSCQDGQPDGQEEQQDRVTRQHI